LGIEKSKVAAELVPLLIIETELPAAPVVTVPTAIVAAAPAAPVPPPPLLKTPKETAVPVKVPTESPDPVKVVPARELTGVTVRLNSAID
jgi:hypothetical protein